MDTGSWRGGSGRGGRGRNDREDQYGRSGNTWQPRDRVDDPAMPRAPQLADKLKGEALYGVNPVIGALQAMRRECHTLYIQEGQSALTSFYQPCHKPHPRILSS